MKKIIFLMLIITNLIFAQENQWVWVKGHNTRNVAGVFGTKGISNTANNPGFKIGAATWTDNSGNLWIFGGSTNGAANLWNDMWKYNPTTNEWTWMHGSSTQNPVGVYGTKGVPSNTNVPGGRFISATWTDSSGNFWLFGGTAHGETIAFGGGGQFFSDMWMFNPTTNQWTWMAGPKVFNNNGTYGTQGVADANNLPGGRTSVVTWVDGNNLYMFGGHGLPETGQGTIPDRMNDLWKFDTVSLQWTWLHGKKVLNDLGNYGTINVSTSTNLPPARSGACGWKSNDGKFYLFGGHAYQSGGGINDRRNDLWKYDVLSNEWVWIKGPNTINNAGNYGVKGVPNVNNNPDGRIYPATAKDQNGNFWMFGGHRRSGVTALEADDLWYYDVSSNIWTFIEGNSAANGGVYGTQGVSVPTNSPGHRNQPHGWTDLNGDMYMFGGRGYDSTNNLGFLSDLWKFNTPLLALATNEFQFENLKIFPNPSTRIININTQAENIGANVEVSNILGQNIKSFELNQLENQIQLDKGMYLLNITKENQKSTYKIIIE